MCRWARYLLLFFAALQVGCSSLFYYPTRGIHYGPAHFGKMPEEIYFPSADGTKLHGWYFPHSKGKKAKALFIFYHGNGENLSSHYVVLLPFLEKGYDFFIFDYRGYGQSEGKPDPKGTVADGEAALRLIHHRFPHTPLVIFAQSLGAVIALRNAIDLKEEIPLHYIVVDSGFDSYQSVARKKMAGAWLSWPFQWLPYLLLSDQYAPEGELQKLSPTPLLVVHGTEDQIINFKLGEKLFGSAHEPKEFWRIEGGGHIDAFARKDPYYRQKLMERLDRILPVQ